MSGTELRWVQGQGLPPRGAIMVGDATSNLWQVLQYRQLLNNGEYWSDWQNIPVTFP